MRWEELFQQFLPENSLLHEQHKSLVKITDEAVLALPIHDNREGLVDLYFMPEKRICMMPMPPRPFHQPECNSGLPQASKVRWGVYTQLRRMLAALDRLAPEFGYVPGQIEIRIFEGLRDLKTQEALFQKKLQEFSELSPEAAYEETTKWISPTKNNIPPHSTGAAVDLRLWDNQKNDFLPMGPFGVIWGANKTAPTYSEEISHTEKLNRLFCLIAAEEAGFVNYVYEFWHFSAGDRYAAFWLRSSHAVYGTA